MRRSSTLSLSAPVAVQRELRRGALERQRRLRLCAHDVEVARDDHRLLDLRVAVDEVHRALELGVREPDVVAVGGRLQRRDEEAPPVGALVLDEVTDPARLLPGAGRLGAQPEHRASLLAEDVRVERDRRDLADRRRRRDQDRVAAAREPREPPAVRGAQQPPTARRERERARVGPLRARRHDLPRRCPGADRLEAPGRQLLQADELGVAGRDQLDHRPQVVAAAGGQRVAAVDVPGPKQHRALL